MNNLYEIYLFNNKAVTYCGEHREAGTISGWELIFVFSDHANIKSYPYFDTIISVNDGNREQTKNAMLWNGEKIEKQG